jgi:hypothetical protein
MVVVAMMTNISPVSESQIAAALNTAAEPGSSV